MQLSAVYVLLQVKKFIPGSGLEEVPIAISLLAKGSCICNSWAYDS